MFVSISSCVCSKMCRSPVFVCTLTLCVLQHEEASLAMFDHLVRENALEPVMKEHGLVLPDDLVFIKEQIAGPQNTVLLSQGVNQPASEPVSQSINLRIM